MTHRATPRASLRTAILLSSAIRGCTCKPDITHHGRNPVKHITVAHDDDCPAVDTGPALVVLPKKTHR